MNATDIDIREGNGMKKGGYVSCRLMASTLVHAIFVVLYAEKNAPAGYVLLSFRGSQRKRGGRARFVSLVYMHTGNKKPGCGPITSWETWATLHAPHEEMARLDWATMVKRLLEAIRALRAPSLLQ